MNSGHLLILMWIWWHRTTSNRD